MKWILIKALIVLAVPFLLVGAFVLISLRDIRLSDIFSKIHKDPTIDSLPVKTA